jgi:NAD(P)H-dependent FMN reductase
MLKLAIIVGSTRDGRKGDHVARWVHSCTQARKDAEYQVIDIAAFGLNLLGESSDTQSRDTAWQNAVSGFDGYVLVTPEYNHAPSAALKNALDIGASAWANKAVAFVGYGGFGGIRAVEMLRLVVANLELAAVKPQVALTLNSDFASDGTLSPRAHQSVSVDQMLDRLVAWARAMQAVRIESRQAA